MGDETFALNVDAHNIEVSTELVRDFQDAMEHLKTRKVFLELYPCEKHSMAYMMTINIDHPGPEIIAGKHKLVYVACVNCGQVYTVRLPAVE